MLLNQDAKHYECYAATEAAGPFNPLNTIGVYISPPDIYWVFAAEFKIWDIAYNAKFHVMYSTIGLSPVYADPIANPVNPDSVIGVSTTLLDPNISNIPFDTLYAP